MKNGSKNYVGLVLIERVAILHTNLQIAELIHMIQWSEILREAVEAVLSTSWGQ